MENPTKMSAEEKEKISNTIDWGSERNDDFQPAVERLFDYIETLENALFGKGS